MVCYGIFWSGQQTIFELPLFQSKTNCEATDMKMNFNSHAKKTRFHRKGFALSLVLKVRVFGSRKWPVGHLRYIKIHHDSVSKNKLNETIIHRGGGG